MLVAVPRTLGPAVDFRHTFLRTYIANRLVGDGTKHPRQEVLALDAIEQDLAAKLKDISISDEIRGVVNEALGLRAFFYPKTAGYITEPDCQVYLPLPVGSLDPPYNQSESLSDFINDAVTRKTRTGIALTTRSGAGKTVSQHKAFLDCFCAASGDPAMAGLLPVWLPTRSVSDNQSINKPSILGLIGEQASGSISRLDTPSTRGPAQRLSEERIQQFVNYSPPLLILVELNSADHADRLTLTNLLNKFQNQISERDQPHQCVVAYRSTEASDRAMTALLAANYFKKCDIKALSPGDAEIYLRNIREFERSVYQQLREKGADVSYPVHDIDAECEKLKNFISRKKSDRETIISTPLLMHFVSQLTGGELESVDTTFDLFRFVVHRNLKRDYETYEAARLSAFGGKSQFSEAVLIAMVRLSVAMLKLDVLSLSDSQVNEFLETPANIPNRFSEMLADKSAYFCRSFSEQERRCIREFSLLRRQGSELRFIHDSLVYFFAAYGLRYFQKPEQPSAQPADIEAQWYDIVADTVAELPTSWEIPVQFLLQTDAINSSGRAEILSRVLASRPERGLAALVLRLSSLSDGGEAETPSHVKEQLDAIAHAVSRFGAACHDRPEIVFSQVVNELTHKADATASVCEMRDALVRRRGSTPDAWVKVGNGYRVPTYRRISKPPSETIHQMVTVSDGDGGYAIIAATYSGTIRRFDERTGELSLIGGHDPDSVGSLTSLYALSRGRVLSSDWSSIYVWDINSTGKPICQVSLSNTRVSIRRLDFVSEDLLAIDDGNQFHLLEIDSGSARIVAQSERCMDNQAFARLSNGTMLGGSISGLLCAWRPDGKNSSVVDLGRVSSTGDTYTSIDSMTAISNQRVAIVKSSVLRSFSPSICIYEFQDSGFKLLKSVSISSQAAGGCPVCQIGENTILVGDGRGVFVWDFGNDKRHYLSEESYVTDIARLPDGRFLCAANGDGYIHEFQRSGPSLSRKKKDQTRLVDMVALSQDRFCVATEGGSKKSGITSAIRILDTTGEVEQEIPLIKNEEVTAITFMSEREIAYAGNEGLIRTFDLASGKSSIVGRHSNLAFIGDDLVDRFWASWNPDSENSRKYFNNSTGSSALTDRYVTDLHLHPNGTLLSAGNDFVNIWSRQPKDKTLLEKLRDHALKHLIRSNGYGFICYPSPSDGFTGVHAAGDMKHRDDWFYTNIVVSLPNDRLVTAAHRTGQIYLWRLGDRDPIRLIGELPQIQHLIAARDNWVVASAGVDLNDQRILAWDTDSKKTEPHILGYQDRVKGLAALPNGWVVTANVEGEILGWDVYDGLIFGFQSGLRISRFTALPNSPEIAVYTEDSELLVFSVNGVSSPNGAVRNVK